MWRNSWAKVFRFVPLHVRSKKCQFSPSWRRLGASVDGDQSWRDSYKKLQSTGTQKTGTQGNSETFNTWKDWILHLVTDVGNNGDAGGVGGCGSSLSVSSSAPSRNLKSSPGWLVAKIPARGGETMYGEDEDSHQQPAFLYQRESESYKWLDDWHLSQFKKRITNLHFHGEYRCWGNTLSSVEALNLLD